MFKISILPEEIEKLPTGAFPGEIHIIEKTGLGYAKAIAYLMSQKIIGFDTETRPVFASNMPHHDVAQACLKKLLGYRGTGGDGVALAKWTGRVFNAMHDINLRVPGAWRAPLTELLDIIDAETALQGKGGIEHGAHVARIKIKAIAPCPCGVLWIPHEIFGEEHVDEVSAAHRAAWMSRLGILYHAGSKDANVVSGMIHCFNVIHNFCVFR